MKKRLLLFIFTLLFLSFSGCSLSESLESYLPPEKEEIQQTEPQQRVYMDELTGIMTAFNGDRISVKTEEALYSFDITNASIECKDGIVAGNEISVIYEGKLENDDTSSVNVLKVADSIHTKKIFKDTILSGQIQSCSPYSMTIKTKEGQQFQIAVADTRQYYQNGWGKTKNIYVHYKGDLPAVADNSQVVHAPHLKLLTISDVEPFLVPTPSPLPSGTTQPEKLSKISGRIITASNGIITLRLNHSDKTLKVDLSNTKCYFKGGFAPGTAIYISYRGEFNGTTTEGLELVQAITENADRLSDKDIQSFAKGTVLGRTKNTLTLRTSEGLILIFNIENALNHLSEGIYTGAEIKAYFNPSKSKNTTIFYCVKLEDV